MKSTISVELEKDEFLLMSKKPDRCVIQGYEHQGNMAHERRNYNPLWESDLDVRRVSSRFSNALSSEPADIE